MAELAGEQIVAQAIQIDFHDGPKIVPFGGMPATSHVLIAVHPGEPGVIQFDVTVGQPFVAERQSLVDLAGLLRAAADMVEDQGRRLV